MLRAPVSSSGRCKGVGAGQAATFRKAHSNVLLVRLRLRVLAFALSSHSLEIQNAVNICTIQVVEHMRGPGRAPGTWVPPISHWVQARPSSFSSESSTACDNTPKLVQLTSTVSVYTMDVTIILGSSR